MTGKFKWLVLVSLCIFATNTVFAGGTTEKSGEELDFVIVAKGVHPWYEPSTQGFAAAAAEIGGIKIRDIASPDWTGEAQAKIVENLIAEGVDGIALAVIDVGALTPLINEAMSRGIPVVTFDDTALDSKQIIFIGTDNYLGGLTAGQEAAKLTNGKGNYIIWVQDLTSANLKLRTKGIRDALSKFPGMKELADVQVAGYTPDQGIGIAESLVQAYPNLTATIECGMNGAIGMSMMMKEKKMAKNAITNIAWTTLPEVVEGIKSGYIHGTVRQNPYAMGYLSTYALKWYIEGKRPSVNYFDSGVVFANAETVDTIDNENLAKTPDLFKDFKALWK